MFSQMRNAFECGSKAACYNFKVPKYKLDLVTVVNYYLPLYLWREEAPAPTVWCREKKTMFSQADQIY